MKNSDDSSKQPPKLMWSVSEFCKGFGIAKSTFYERVKQNKIKTIAFMGRRGIPDDEVRRLQAEGCE